MVNPIRLLIEEKGKLGYVSAKVEYELVNNQLGEEFSDLAFSCSKKKKIGH